MGTGVTLMRTLLAASLLLSGCRRSQQQTILCTIYPSVPILTTSNLGGEGRKTILFGLVDFPVEQTSMVVTTGHASLFAISLRLPFDHWLLFLRQAAAANLKILTLGWFTWQPRKAHKTFSTLIEIRDELTNSYRQISKTPMSQYSFQDRQVIYEQRRFLQKEIDRYNRKIALAEGTAPWLNTSRLLRASANLQTMKKKKSFFQRLGTATRYLFSVNGYRAAEHSRLRGYHRNLQVRPESAELDAGDRIKVIARLLDARRNNPLVRSICRLRETDVVGAGIRPRAKSGDDELDARLEGLWEEYSEEPEVTQTLTMREVQNATCELASYLWRRRPFFFIEAEGCNS